MPKTCLVITAILITIFSTLAGATPQTTGALQFTLLYSNNVVGETEPCG